MIILIIFFILGSVLIFFVSNLELRFGSDDSLLSLASIKRPNSSHSRNFFSLLLWNTVTQEIPTPYSNFLAKLKWPIWKGQIWIFGPKSGSDPKADAMFEISSSRNPCFCTLFDFVFRQLRICNSGWAGREVESKIWSNIQNQRLKYFYTLLKLLIKVSIVNFFKFWGLGLGIR